MAFHDPIFIGGGAYLNPETRTFRPYKWVNGKQVFGKTYPYPDIQWGRIQAVQIMEIIESLEIPDNGESRA